MNREYAHLIACTNRALEISNTTYSSRDKLIVSATKKILKDEDLVIAGNILYEDYTIVRLASKFVYKQFLGILRVKPSAVEQHMRSNQKKRRG